MLPEQITSSASFWRDIAPDETAFQSFWGWITDQANQEIAVDGKHKVIFGRSMPQDGSDKLKAVLKSKWQEYIPVGSPGSPSVEGFEIPDADEKRIFSYHYKKSSDGVAKVTRPQNVKSLLGDESPRRCGILFDLIPSYGHRRYIEFKDIALIFGAISRAMDCAPDSHITGFCPHNFLGRYATSWAGDRPRWFTYSWDDGLGLQIHLRSFMALS
ncbi:hypothetical protein BJX68DRAFT_232605, partial [Aspergillus pseudodeflectus]